MRKPILVVVVISGFLIPFAGATGAPAPMGTAFTYQGHLASEGSPVTGSCEFAFGLYDEPSDGNQLSTTLSLAAVVVNEGLFTMELDFGEQFNGQARWLEMAVCCPSGGCTLETLSPRTELTPAPHALALPGLRTEQDPSSPNIIGGSPSNDVAAGVAGATIGGGGSTGAAQTITGDFGVIGGGEYNEAGGAHATIGGGQLNAVTDDHGTVAGGAFNRAGTIDGDPSDAMFATISGGAYNTALATYATVGGGRASIANRPWSTVGGGESNVADGEASVVGGGRSNRTETTYATVAGGYRNTASGEYSAIPGGTYNRAEGDFSLAAGRRAIVNHQGTFVWADSTDADFTSTGNDQFLIRASGGVGIGTNSPGALLDVRNSFHMVNFDPKHRSYSDGGSWSFDFENSRGSIGTPASLVEDDRTGAIRFRGYDGSAYRNSASITAFADGTPGTSDMPGRLVLNTTPAGSSSSLPRLTIKSDGDVGIGTVSPGERLDVDGNIHASGTITSGSSITINGTTNVISSSGDLELHVNGGRGLRIETDATSPNFVAGYADNYVSAGVYGGTVSGGGASGAANRVAANYGTVGGGNNNLASTAYSTVAGGHGNTASGAGEGHATVAGGSDCNATGTYSAVVGGRHCDASNWYSFVGGGYNNTASSSWATVAGGEGNNAGGGHATVPGGRENSAQGSYSLAAGYRAKANNAGCFVWGDSSTADVECNNNNRWVARASGGVYFYTSSGLTSGVYVSAGGNSWNGVSDRNTKENFEPVDQRAALEQVAELPIQTYNLKSQDPSIRHIGPVAQDFAEFGFGESDAAINMQDADGVALAAIQGLYDIVKEKDAEVDRLKKQNERLDVRLAALETIVNKLTEESIGGER